MSYPRQIFEFDPAKAASNLKKHGVSFAEAMTVFEDPLASTLPDDQHSLDENRFITVGMSFKLRLCSSFTLRQTLASESSEHALSPQPRENSMSKPKQLDPLAPRPNLDFSKGVRGKHFARMQQGTNIVLIAPDLLETFPDSEAVNEALRSLKKIANRSAKPAQRPRKTAPAR